MSFVGPQALLLEEIEVRPKPFSVPRFRQTIQDPRVKEEEFLEAVPLEKIPGYAERHHVPPGLTGLAQVYADRDIPRRHKFQYDLLYIKRQSFWLDLRLLALSFWITCHGTWKHRGRKFRQARLAGPRGLMGHRRGGSRYVHDTTDGLRV